MFQNSQIGRLDSWLVGANQTRQSSQHAPMGRSKTESFAESVHTPPLSTHRPVCGYCTSLHVN